MAPHTVALLGHTGRIGSASFKGLLELNALQTIKLVVLHRPGSDLSSVPADIEARELDLAQPDEGRIKSALVGINVLISLVAMAGVGDQRHLFKPLSELDDFVTYLTPMIGQPRWSADAEPEDERIGQLLSTGRDIVHKTKEYNVGLTRIASGVFTDFFFDYKYLSTDIDANKVVLPTEAGNKGIPLVSNECLGDAIREIASRSPQAIKGKTFYAFDYNPTGREIIQEFEKIHGTAPQVVDWTSSDYEKDVNNGPLSGSAAVYLKNWPTGDWRWEGERLGLSNRDFSALTQSYWAAREESQ